MDEVRNLIQRVTPLAKHLGVSNTAVYRWIRVNRLPPERLAQIGNYYQKPIRSLLPLTGSELNNKVLVVNKPRSLLKLLVEGDLSINEISERTGASLISIKLVKRYWGPRLKLLYDLLEGIEAGTVTRKWAACELNVSYPYLHQIRKKYGYLTKETEK